MQPYLKARGHHFPSSAKIFLHFRELGAPFNPGANPGCDGLDGCRSKLQGLHKSYCKCFLRLFWLLSPFSLPCRPRNFPECHPNVKQFPIRMPIFRPRQRLYVDFCPLLPPVKNSNVRYFLPVQQTLPMYTSSFLPAIEIWPGNLNVEVEFVC